MSLGSIGESFYYHPASDDLTHAKFGKWLRHMPKKCEEVGLVGMEPASAIDRQGMGSCKVHKYSTAISISPR